MRTAFWTLSLSLCWLALFLGLGVFSGWVTISARVPWVMNPLAFVYQHLRSSVFPFGMLFAVVAYLILRLRRCLTGPDTDLSRITFYERMLNATISSFFGVGVIWTAVGMESALTHALEGMGAGEAGVAAISAWSIMERLVNGGLLLALSTTIFGGICGYSLRLLKIFILGQDWDRFILRETGAHGSSRPS